MALKVLQPFMPFWEMKYAVLQQKSVETHK